MIAARSTKICSIKSGIPKEKGTFRYFSSTTGKGQRRGNNLFSLQKLPNFRGFLPVTFTQPRINNQRRRFCTTENKEENSTTESTKHENLPFRIVSEDENYLFVYKPIGEPVMRDDVDQTTKVDGRVLHEKVLEYGQEKNMEHLRLVHRIEKLASGILIYSKNPNAESHFHTLSSVNGEKSELQLYNIAATTPLPRCRIKAMKGFSNLEHGLLRKTADRYSIVGKGSGVEVKARYKVVEMETYKTSSFFPEYYNMMKEMDLKEEEVVERDPNARVERITKEQEEKKQVKEMMTSHYLKDRMQLALIVFKPITKKKFQLRAYCNYLLSPIVGDVSHFSIPNEKEGRSGLMLHLAYVSFPSPNRGKMYEIKCNPNDYHDPLWRGIFNSSIPFMLNTLFAK